MRLPRARGAGGPSLPSRRTAAHGTCRGAFGGCWCNCAAADGARADCCGDSPSARARGEASARQPAPTLAQYVEQPSHDCGQQQRGRQRKAVLAAVAYEVDITGQAPEPQLAQQWIDPADERQGKRENNEPPEQDSP